MFSIHRVAITLSKAIILSDINYKIRVSYVLGEVSNLLMREDQIEFTENFMLKQHITSFIEHLLPDSGNRFGYSFDLLKTLCCFVAI